MQVVINCRVCLDLGVVRPEPYRFPKLYIICDCQEIYEEEEDGEQ